MAPMTKEPRNTWRVSADAADLSRPEVTPRPMSVAARPKPITFDLSRTAILVIDMQNDFCHSDGWLAGIGVDVAPARGPIEPLNLLLPPLRAAGVPVIFVNWGNRPDLANISPALRHVYDPSGEDRGLAAPIGPGGSRVLTEGEWSAALVDEIVRAETDVFVSKFRMSGFWDTPLDSILRNLRLDTLLFAGVNADQCVLHTLADANFLGYDTVLVEDATATTSPQFCMDATLYNVRQIFGFTLTTDDLVRAIGDMP